MVEFMFLCFENARKLFVFVLMESWLTLHHLLIFESSFSVIICKFLIFLCDEVETQLSAYKVVLN